MVEFRSYRWLWRIMSLVFWKFVGEEWVLMFKKNEIMLFWDMMLWECSSNYVCVGLGFGV